MKEPLEMNCYEVREFLRNAATHVQDGSCFLQVNRYTSYSEPEEAGRWWAEDLLLGLALTGRIAASAWDERSKVPSKVSRGL